jgi:hypothetical protein
MWKEMKGDDPCVRETSNHNTVLENKNVDDADNNDIIIAMILMITWVIDK